MKLSKHLSLEEVVDSDYANHHHINNLPTEEHLANLKILAEKIFEPIRNHFNTPIYISSGYRSKELNQAIGGATNSQHLRGESLDLDQDYAKTGVTNIQVFNYIKDNLIFDQLIFEFGNDEHPAWVHVSYSSIKNRKQILRSIKIKGKTKYINYES